MKPTWRNQLIEARKLPDKELRHHASISKDNRHRCEDCFCCAAWTILENRAEQRKRSTTIRHRLGYAVLSLFVFGGCGMRALGGTWPDNNDLAAIQVMNQLLSPPPFYWPTMENPAGVTCYQGVMGTTCN